MENHLSKWEENKHVQPTPSAPTPENEQELTIIVTETRSVKTEWIVIGGQRKRIRYCPKCGEMLIYESKRGYFTAKRKNSMCQSCSALAKMARGESTLPYRGGCTLSDDHRRKISASNIERYKKFIHPMLGKHHTSDALEKMRTAASGEKNPNFGGKCMSIEVRKKISETRKARKIPGPKISEAGLRRLRIKRIREIEIDRNNGHQIVPSFNKTACGFFDRVNSELGWSGRHATNGGEHFLTDLGYWVDYYEPIRNIVIEWDERQHFNVDGTLKTEDVIRQRQIVEKLGCKFFRYDERHTNAEDFMQELKRYD